LINWIIKDKMNVDMNKIGNYLKTKLPLYMIPNFLIEIKEIPITSSGKFDRRGLPEPIENVLIINEYIEAESETEKKLVKIYSKILNMNENKIKKNKHHISMN